jgi:hypothetical protein
MRERMILPVICGHRLCAFARRLMTTATQAAKHAPDTTNIGTSINSLSELHAARDHFAPAALIVSSGMGQ